MPTNLAIAHRPRRKSTAVNSRAGTAPDRSSAITRAGVFSAYPGETFYGTISRIARSMDTKTRSMPVELDVFNAHGRLAAGMYPAIKWPVRGDRSTLLVPSTSVVTNSERTFVIRVSNGVAQWVNVSRGARVGELIEVFGALKDGDTIVRRGTDEIREGAKVNIQASKPS